MRRAGPSRRIAGADGRHRGRARMRHAVRGAGTVEYVVDADTLDFYFSK